MVAEVRGQAGPESLKLATLRKVFVPPGDDAPEQTLGGATRGGCAAGPLNEVKVVTKHNDLAQPFLEAQLPQGMAQQIFFSLRDSNNQTLYQGFLPVEQDHSLVQVEYHDLATLQENKEYKWRMAVICGEALSPDSPVFEGTL
jgi:hypothetical protein